MSETITEKKTKWWLKLLTLEFIIITLLLLTAIIVFALAVDMVFIKKTTTLDENVFNYVGQHVTPARTRFMLAITFLGNHKFLIPANFALLIYYTLFKKNRWLSIRVAALALSSLTIKLVLKAFFHRPRPEIPLLYKVQGYSFPSGHALIGVAFYGLLIYIAWNEIKNKWWRVVTITALFSLILLISFSRIYLRVHYTSDVMAGLAMGFIWLTVSLWLIGRFEKKNATAKALAVTQEKN
jgi:membrane-associated phospholipid phosphatase